MIQCERWADRRAADLDGGEQRRVYAGGYEPGPNGTTTEGDPRRVSSLDVLLGYLRSADLFKDHTGPGFL